MSTHNICFHREIEKNIDTFWLKKKKKHLIKSYNMYVYIYIYIYIYRHCFNY